MPLWIKCGNGKRNRAALSLSSYVVWALLVIRTAGVSLWTKAYLRPCKEVFVRLYEDELIYRGKRLVNWDPKLHTAISDLSGSKEKREYM